MEDKIKIRIKHEGLLVPKGTLPLAVRVIDDETLEIDLSAYKKLVKNPKIV